MMKTNFLFRIFLPALIIVNHAAAQWPLTKMWDYTYGGVYYDYLSSFQQTSDHGYLMCGSTLSNNDGDVTEPSRGSYDMWFMKTDVNGVKLWDKRFGGSDGDGGKEGLQTRDGGYIIGGTTQSPVSGDVTGTPRGGPDFWIVKTDAAGNKLWDKRYGGSGVDGIMCMLQSADGGYLFGGYSESPISGDVTEAPRGLDDYWILKTDSLGAKQWDKRFGGSELDELQDLKETIDGGFLLGGITLSNLSGDITEPTRGLSDYWVVKVNSSGTKLWDKRYGGADYEGLVTLTPTNDGGAYVGGNTTSSISGEVTQPPHGAFTPDVWIVKIDSLGTKQWDKRYGGNDAEDEIGYIVPTADGGLLISCTSYSNASYEKTENNMGPEQAWVIKTDNQFNVEWNKTLFTTGHDEGCYAVPSADGCYALAVWSDGQAAGDKSQACQDTATGNPAPDFWIMKYCDLTAPPLAGFTAPHHVCPGTCTAFLNNSLHATWSHWAFQGGVPSLSTDMDPANICYSTPGTYDVQLIVGNSNGSDTLYLANYITVYPYPLPQGITQSGDTLTAVPGANGYRWYYNGVVIPGATTYFYVAIASGDYNVVATDGNGCEVEAVIFNVLAGVPHPANGSPFSVFPNPAGDIAVIDPPFRTVTTRISIYNLMGEKIYTTPENTSSPANACAGVPLTIDCSLFPPGVYAVEINTTSGQTWRVKFVKS